MQCSWTSGMAVLALLAAFSGCGGGGGGGGGGKGSGGGDNLAPSAPPGLTATAYSSTEVDLTWNASADNVGVVGYDVFRDGSFWTSVPGTLARDTGRSPGTTYCYEVAAFDAAGNRSARSGPACATTDFWTRRLSGSDIDLMGISWTGSGFLAVGEDRETLTSPDGITWTSHISTFSTPLSLSAVVWTGDQFIAADRWISSSPDGVAWTIQHIQSDEIRGMASSGSLVVAVGEGGAILTSPDGETWTRQTAGTLEWLHDVTWANGEFLAVGAGGAILASSDGIAWTPRLSGTGGTLRGVTWSGTQFVVVGLSETLTSPDGMTWTPGAAAGNLESVAWSQSLGLYVAVGWWPAGIVTSPDGATWTPRTANEFYSFNDVAWDGAQFVAVGDLGEIATSSDGLTWTTRHSGSDLQNVTWTGSEFIAVGDYGKTLRSVDGVAWSFGTTGENGDYLRDIASSGVSFVAAGQSYLLHSADAVSWPQREWLGAATAGDSVLWAGSQFVSVSDSGGVQTSPDGITWTFRTSGTNEPLLDLAWSGATIVAVGFNGVVLTSPDGISWNPESSGTAAHLRGVAWSGSGFAAVGDGGAILSSSDGAAWTAEVSGTTNTLQEVIWAGTEFVAVGDSTTVLTSPDGFAWSSSSPLGSYGSLRGAAWSGSRLVVVGVDSRIISLP